MARLILVLILLSSLYFATVLQAQDSTATGIKVGKWVVGFLDVKLGIISGLKPGDNDDRFGIKSDIYLGAGKSFGIWNVENRVGIFGSIQFYGSADKVFNPLVGIGVKFQDYSIMPSFDINESYIDKGSWFQKHFRVVLSGEF